jgi:hypothetical protein
MLLGLGRRRPDPEGATRRVKAWAEAALPEGTAVSVSELACAEPGCPPVETVILVMAPGRPTRPVRLHRPAAGLREGDVLAALAGLLLAER